MTYTEHALIFHCGKDALIGIRTQPTSSVSTGVLIVVGGPQYRVGSHRQFTLLARQLAAENIPSLRFDYRGMGDSEGEARNFEDIDADIRSAIDAFFASDPALKQVAIWGLCDAASAGAFYAPSDTRVSHLVLLNPWVHTPEGTAKTYLKHYYIRRVTDPHFWCKLAAGKFSARTAMNSFLSLLSQARSKGSNSVTRRSDDFSGLPLPTRLLHRLQQFKGKVLLILSGNDFTAREFMDVTAGCGAWQKFLNADQTRRHDIEQANHTFSKRIWRDEVTKQTLRCLTHNSLHEEIP